MSAGSEPDASATALAGPEPVHPRPPTPVHEEAATARRGTGDLGKRLLTASILIPFVTWIIYLGGLVYLAVVTAFVLLMMREFYTLIEEKGAHPQTRWGYAAGVALPVVAYVGNEYHTTILMTVILLGVMVNQLRRPRIEEALASISGTFFGVFYVGWLFSHAVVLRNFHDVVSYKMGAQAAALHPEHSGAYYVFFAAVCLVVCDAGAYFAGRRFGRRKLAPDISPGKSVEGALGGLLLGTAAGPVAKAGFSAVFPEVAGGFGWGAALLFGLALSAVGILGDLVESLLKRDAAVKDAGGLLPGMGGLLDRLDSPLLGIPVMYYLLLAYTFLRVG